MSLFVSRFDVDRGDLFFCAIAESSICLIEPPLAPPAVLDTNQWARYLYLVGYILHWG